MLRYVKYLIFMLPMLATMAMVIVADDPRCTGFARLEGGALTISTYRWSAVPDIDEYKLNFYGAGGQFVTSFWVQPPTTAMDINLGDLATGAYFQWEVEALENGGQKVCNTGRSGMAALPNERPPVNSSGGLSPAVTAAPPGSESTAESTAQPPQNTQEPTLTYTPTITQTSTPQWQGSTTPMPPEVTFLPL